MKKRNLKNYLKLGILLFGISILITNCDKDELFVNEIEQNNPFTLKKLIQKEYANNSNLNKVLENFNSSSFKSRNSEKTNLNVDTSQSNYLESTDGAFHSYSFAIIDLDSDLIKNLVISLQPDNTYKTFLVTYNLTDTDKEIIYQEIDANASDYLNRTLTCTTTLSYTCTQTQTNTYCTDCDNPSTANTITVTECVAYSVNSQTTCTQNNSDLLNGSDELIYGDSGGNGGNFIWANGSSSSGYTNGGSMIMLPLPSPCDKVDDLINSNSNIKLRLKQLLENNSNNEYGFQIRKNPTTKQNVPGNIFDRDGNYNIWFNYDKYTFSVAHKHPDGNDDGFELFSGYDILNIAELASNYIDVGNELPNTFTIFLVTDGITFALNIKDIQSLNVLKTHIESDKKSKRFHDDLIDMYGTDVNVLTGKDSSISDQQKRLFQFLNDKNIKANLLKASYNSNNEITGWKIYDENKNTYDDCNE